MPSPSKLSLFLSLTATAGLLYGGAYFAAGIGEASAAEPNLEQRELPKLAPVPAFEQDASLIKASTNIAATEKVAKQAPVPLAPLSITISGVRNADGKILVLVFDEKQAFANYDYTKAAGYTELPASPQPIKHTFKNLTSGPYAITLFHDENNNQDFDMENGIPLEGYGTSGAKGPYDEVNFERALTKAGNIPIRMYYLN